MALQYDVLYTLRFLNGKANIVKITADGSYAAARYTLDPGSCGVTKIDSAICVGVTGIGLDWRFDQATGKMFSQKTGSATSGQFIEGAAGDVSTADIMTVLVIDSSGAPGPV